MNNIDELIGDHLFQLNLVLWLTQPIASNIGIRPLFSQSGFSVYSVSPSLALPIPVREEIREKKIIAQDGCSPDVLLNRKEANFFLLVECKKQSFGTGSSTSEQARTLLLLEGQILGESLALSPTGAAGSAVSYITRDDQKSPMQLTCENLKKEITAAGFKTNPTYCFGIKHDFDRSVYMVIDSIDSRSLGIVDNGTIKIIEGRPDTDPRPLYFIPLDPSVEQNEYGKKTLEQRLLSELLSLIGRAKIPSKTLFTVEDLLEKATWGMYGVWRDRDARTHLRRQVNSFLKNRVAALFPQNFQQDHDTWTFNVEAPGDKEIVLSAFQKTEVIEELKITQLGLFEENKSLLQ
jgi:hypothetical protein